MATTKEILTAQLDNMKLSQVQQFMHTLDKTSPMYKYMVHYATERVLLIQLRNFIETNPTQ